MKIDFTPIVRPGFVKLAERTDSGEATPIRFRPACCAGSLSVPLTLNMARLTISLL